ncbi:hypothetical protein Rhal01_00451 [Rubritalea halochordaticola]|uniref:Signal peptidase I n=1 Tax=Rubritalea halochordaticola TaxID=714537 RepID=A0ABP9UUZ5_9BACT
MFTPKWKKEAKMLHKGSKKFLHYKRDLLKEDRISEIEARRLDLKKAIKGKDKEAALEAGKQLQATCENALPRYKGPDALTENVEVFFVAIVIALGLRTYYLQPFRIPTNSMKPTLNGFIGEELSQDKWPAYPIRIAQIATHGRDYISVKTDKEDKIVDLKEYQALHFFTRTKIVFSSGRTETVPGSARALIDVMNRDEITKLAGIKLASEDDENFMKVLMQTTLPANFTVAEGYVSSGDLVLVDKFSYHFRSPKAGEVFVFDTRKIREIREKPGYGSHYIKRLIGVPGDTIALEGGETRMNPYNGMPKKEIPSGRSIYYDTQIYRNGKKMTAPGVLRVESKEGYYDGYSTMDRLQRGSENAVKLAYKPSTGLSEYWAMGDNSQNSSDSRDWGTVKEFNVLGPALFSLWPFGSGHWGIIK